MRLDKFLWAVRFYKTRSMATDACKKHHVSVNGQTAKPSKEVFPGDKLRIRKNQIDYEILILNLPPNRLSAKLVALYIKDMTPPEAFEHQKLAREAQLYYRRKGLGRPTKKDRRQLDEFLDGDDSTDF